MNKERKGIIKKQITHDTSDTMSSYQYFLHVFPRTIPVLTAPHIIPKKQAKIRSNILSTFVVPH